MKDFDLGNLYAFSLKYKILFGLLFSILPILAIVTITYDSAKNSALLNSSRQMELISTSGGGNLNVYFAAASETFLEWTEEDVFGMAIEFKALDELKKHLTSLQRSNPEFYLLLITDKEGNVLEESQSTRLKETSQESLKDFTLKEVQTLSLSLPRGVTLVHNQLIGPPQDRSDPALLFFYHTTNYAGKHNGYFLAFMEISTVQSITDSIFREMKKSGYTTSRIAVVNNQTEEILVYSGPELDQEDTQPFGPPMQTLLNKATPGQINVFHTASKAEHIAVIPINTNTAFFSPGGSGKHNLHLSLITSVEEGEIMANAQQTLTTAAIIGTVGALVIMAIGYFTIRSITGPISNLVDVLRRYSAGDSSVRADVSSNDEIGYFSNEFNILLEKINNSAAALKKSEARYRQLFADLQEAVKTKTYHFRFAEDQEDSELTSSLNQMLNTLETADLRAQEEDWLKTGLTHLSERISGEHNLQDLCLSAITFISNYISAQVGTIFVRSQEDDGNNDAEHNYELIASFAFTRRKGLTNRFKPGEGLVGQAAFEKKIILFKDIPEDYLRIESSLGFETPKNILIIPLNYEETVEGVIELGASFDFTRRHLKFAEQLGSLIAVAIHAAKANDRQKSLLIETKKQSRILQEQQSELQRAYKELEEQTEILRQSEARLQVQQEELQASNEEMEEKNQMLEEQKRENEQTNRNLRQKQQELEEKARQLQLATKYKSEFLSNMSHELRTPLNSILLLAKMLSENDEKNLTDDQIESAASIHRGGQTLLHLINDILDLSKIEAGKIELNIGSARPENIAKDFKMEFSPVAKNKNLQFITEVDENLPATITTDVHRLEQIIRNLLGNAFKFTETGSVSLTIYRPDPATRIGRNDLQPEEAVAFSVKDTGPGIDKEKLDLIFEAFKQVDGSISRRHGGTGLGLSISRELARLIGGEIQVESTLNRGAEFILFIPEKLSKVSEELPPSSPAEPKTISLPPHTAASEKSTSENSVEHPAIPPEKSTLPAQGKSMLIIEDDQEFSSILADFFAKNGYEPIIALTGEQGVKYAIERLPTAIILDIGLPGIDGWTVLSELKNNPETRHIPVHIMSAYDEPSQGLKKGAVGYLTKPVDINGLKSALAKIEHVLENSVKELLIVEDDANLRNNILQLMSSRDIRSTTAETGHKAITLLRSNRFDCMILDLGLPDISGFTLLDEIEKDPLINRLPVIIFTGRDLSKQETERLESYSSSIVLKSALSMERLLDETALFLHRVEQEMPESQQKLLQEIREKDSTIEGKKVLLVDDDMRNAFALSKFLKSKGVTVSIADNGKKALELLESEEIPDIVLMDIMMPVMDGYETMKEIRKKPQFKDLPILALTAKAMETDREECIRSGANDYLSKPIDTQKLLSMLRIWMY